jgi:hypothetical protein
MPREKSVNVNVRMSPEEVEMLKAVAGAKGLSAADIIRQAIRAEYGKLEKKGARK